MHDILFENQTALEDDDIEQYAESLGLDSEKLMGEVRSHAHAFACVKEDFKSGARNGVNGTPTFFVNGVRYDGAFGVTGTLCRTHCKRLMKAIYLKKKGGAESLVSGEIPKPTPKAGEVLVKVYATAVMPTELSWEPTFNQPSGEPRPFPIILSHEFSGVVESLGANVSNVKVGDEVIGINDWFTNGAQAEYCVVVAKRVGAQTKIAEPCGVGGGADLGIDSVARAF